MSCPGGKNSMCKGPEVECSRISKRAELNPNEGGRAVGGSCRSGGPGFPRLAFRETKGSSPLWGAATGSPVLSSLHTLCLTTILQSG